jgi:hypothetical protein
MQGNYSHNEVGYAGDSNKCEYEQLPGLAYFQGVLFFAFVG